MLLPSATPTEWLQTHFVRFFSTYVQATDLGVAHRSLSVDEVLAEDALMLREMRDSLVADGASVRGAATYLAGWFGGLAASALGFAFVGAGAGFLVDPVTIRWMVHPDGWTDAVELGEVVTVVPPDHPWCALPNVLVIDDARERGVRVVSSLVEAVRPVIDACHGLARVGRVGLWNEVGDGFASALVYQATIPVMEPVVEAVRALVATPGAPWKARATLRVAAMGPVNLCVMQKGGCCLVFTGAYGHDDEGHDAEGLDGDQRAYRERFSDRPGDANYCVNCPRRAFADCQARQLWWRARELDTELV